MSDSTTPQDDAAMSPASTGSVDGVNLATADLFHAEIARLHGVNERLRLTDAERKTVERAHDLLLMRAEQASAATLRGLLERLK